MQRAMRRSWGLETHSMFYILNNGFYQTDSEDGHKDETDVAVKFPLTLASTFLPPLLSVDADGPGYRV
jgi:hypothetical protein